MVHAVYTVDRFARCLECVERIDHMNSPQHEHLGLEFYLTNGLTREPTVAGTDLARLQRAPEGTEESASGGGHDVVDGGGMGVRDILDTVVCGDCAVRTKQHRLSLRGQPCLAEWADAAYDAHVRTVGDL